MSDKLHFDAKEAYGRPRTACGSVGDRTFEHDKVTCLQCKATKVYKEGPRVRIEGVVVPKEHLARLRAENERLREAAKAVVDEAPTLPPGHLVCCVDPKKIQALRDALQMPSHTEEK